MHSKAGILMVGGLLLVIVLSSAPTQKTHLPETTHLIDSIQGPALYTAYCAVCHGRDGKGAGSMAKSLLARIAMRNGGRFPMARIQRIISGEEPLPAGHGTQEMPVWGPFFRKSLGTKIWGGCAWTTSQGTSRGCRQSRAADY
jgi:mono/diheme cytochrome c family protein